MKTFINFHYKTLIEQLIFQIIYIFLLFFNVYKLNIIISHHICRFQKYKFSTIDSVTFEKKQKLLKQLSHKNRA